MKTLVQGRITISLLALALSTAVASGPAYARSGADRFQMAQSEQGQERGQGGERRGGGGAERQQAPDRGEGQGRALGRDAGPARGGQEGGRALGRDAGPASQAAPAAREPAPTMRQQAAPREERRTREITPDARARGDVSTETRTERRSGVNVRERSAVETQRYREPSTSVQRSEVYRSGRAYRDDRGSRYRSRDRAVSGFVFLGGPRVVVRNYGAGWCRGLHRGRHYAPRVGMHGGTHRGLFRC